MGLTCLELPLLVLLSSLHVHLPQQHYIHTIYLPLDKALGCFKSLTQPTFGHLTVLLPPSI